jgi:hypothetical protein
LAVLFLIATLIAAAAAVDSAFDRKEGGARYLGLNRLDIPGSERRDDSLKNRTDQG